MTDKELLELAAKAAGHTDTVQTVIEAGWNPLTHDGDALRLAVKLGMSVGTPTENSWDVLVCDEEITVVMEESGGDDPYAATRRAIVRAAAEIVRAAAEIGKSL